MSNSRFTLISTIAFILIGIITVLVLTNNKSNGSTSLFLLNWEIARCPVIVIGRIDTVRVTPAPYDLDSLRRLDPSKVNWASIPHVSFDIAFITVSKVLKNTFPYSKIKKGDKLPLAMPSVNSGIVSTTDVRYKKDDEGIWFLSVHDYVYFAGHHQIPQPISREAEILRIIEEARNKPTAEVENYTEPFDIEKYISYIPVIVRGEIETVKTNPPPLNPDSLYGLDPFAVDWANLPYIANDTAFITVSRVLKNYKTYTTINVGDRLPLAIPSINELSYNPTDFRYKKGDCGIWFFQFQNYTCYSPSPEHLQPVSEEREIANSVLKWEVDKKPLIVSGDISSIKEASWSNRPNEPLHVVIVSKVIKYRLLYPKIKEGDVLPLALLPASRFSGDSVSNQFKTGVTGVWFLEYGEKYDAASPDNPLLLSKEPDIVRLIESLGYQPIR